MRNRARTVLLAASAGAIVIIVMAAIVSMRTSDVELPGTSGGPPIGTPIDMGDMRKTGEQMSGLPILSDFMPEFTGIAGWLNGAAVSQADLRGKVVLVDFWTYSCINCIRTLPYVTSWHEKYADKGLVIVGVHTPEFAFEKVAKNVEDAIRRHAIGYVVAQDNDFATWNAYGNRYWPAKYLFDAKGRLRYAHFGEGDYDVTERNIQSLLTEAGAEINVPMTETVSTVDAQKVGTPEIYFGSGRLAYLSSPEEVLEGEIRTYSAPKTLPENTFAYEGAWKVETERAVAAKSGAGISLRYVASNLNMVLGATDGGILARVTLDGAPIPASLRGPDVFEKDGETFVRVRDERLYNIVDAKGDYGEHVFRIEFLAPGSEAYTFTFG